MTAILASAVLAYCRPGFEAECGAELEALAGDFGLAGECEATPGAAFVLLRLAQPLAPSEAAQVFDWRRAVFARQTVIVIAAVDGLDRGERIAPIVQASAGLRPVRELFLEMPDTNEGKRLTALTRTLEPPLATALREAKLMGGGREKFRLHVFFDAGSRALIGLSPVAGSSPWPMGIPRLSMPSEAPSRSVLKLAEALQTLMTREERERLIRPAGRCVDLGAAPGGWSWQMASLGLRVTAVDNGRLAPAVLATELVEHLAADGFVWRPRGKVDWLLCDMVAPPARIAALVADWVARGQARNAIFNLKLPTKQRLAEVERCRHLIEAKLAGAGLEWTLRLKQLYHDREEVTAFLSAAPMERPHAHAQRQRRRKRL